MMPIHPEAQVMMAVGVSVHTRSVPMSDILGRLLANGSQVWILSRKELAFVD